MIFVPKAAVGLIPEGWSLRVKTPGLALESLRGASDFVPKGLNEGSQA